MEKQKPWQFYLILAVIILTLYNILPTIFYYTKPLKDPIDATRAKSVSTSIAHRVNDLEEDATEWLYSFGKLLGLKPTSIAVKDNDPRMIDVSFKTSQEAQLFKRFLPRAGALIPFVPSQLGLDATSAQDEATKTVTVIRQVGVRLDPAELDSLFTFSPKYDEKGNISPFYRDFVYDRTAQLALGFGGTSQVTNQLVSVANSPDSSDEDVINLAKEIAGVEQTFGKESPLTKRYYATLGQLPQGDAEALVQKFITRAESLKTRLTGQVDSLKASKESLNAEQKQNLSLLENQRSALERAANLLRRRNSEIKSGSKPLALTAVQSELAKGKVNADHRQVLSLQGRNPYIQALIIDWANDKILTQFYGDVDKIRNSEGNNETEALQKDRLNQAIINDIARVSRLSDETIAPDDDNFAVQLNSLTGTTGFLALNLGQLADLQAKQLQQQLNQSWTPTSPDLVRDAYPIYDYRAFKGLKPEDQKLGLVIYAPTMDRDAPPAGFRPGSLYVIAKGLNPLMQKLRSAPEAPETQEFGNDLQQLNALLMQNGFIGYPGSSFGIAPEYSKDYIFELDDSYANLLKATRENFSVKGSKRVAVLDFTDVEQRILTWNKIQDQIQEDLLKWKEEYNTAQVDLNASNHYQVPAPTKNVYWENAKLSFLKYFKGDERKVLKWGLDLSGGKTVRIGLRDQNGKTVTNPEDLQQARNELYTRVNKMGVSERTIRIEDKNIILDFPGSQGLSASDLVKASAMYFHIVNEKFGSYNPALKSTVNQFLQEVWNEAVVTNRKDIDSLQEIAWQHLGGEANGQETRPRSDAAKTLWDNGLRLANPKDKSLNSSYNDTLSAVATFRGEDYADWEGQTHPLLFVFHNYALEGSALKDIQVGYDPSKGNILSFGVKSSFEGARSGNPRDDLYAWTSQFAEDKISGTPKDFNGKGWRMAVILNGAVISNPGLQAALRDGGSISGRFSQREINQLAADLKAGSLSFTPRILSEQNVSPELGQEERTKGIVASLVALALVVVAMIGYYHFAGIVASVAVLFNILVMWGVLQNLDAALTLPGIAGIVLTIGMAVDANVLVFERVREEFKISGRIASAIQAGYRKAFSAIIDSNITTIIAALILIQFDSGPIKGFAVTLIIGILSSMFTALFMTRYFFAGWVQNPKHKELTMSQFIGHTNFDFLAQTKKAVIISLIAMIAGGALFFGQIKTLFGMDFTGGYSLVVDLSEKPNNPDYRIEAADALLAKGATSNDFQIRELSRPNQLRIQLGMGMEEKGHPFYQLPDELKEGKYSYSYEHNPRIDWVVQALNARGLQIQKSQLDTLDRDWTVMSGQISDQMRTNAILGLGLALLCILIYITFRFEFKFAIAAVVGLVHDVIITVGILALFHWFGFPVQIDLQVIGALMTIIGYSLNDTIIVFDRIREDIKLMRKMKFQDIINHALNVTLSRTIMTGGTTLLVLLALVLLGGKSIFAFSLVMTIGVIVGTLSSLFIAAPVLLYFHDREERQLEDKAQPRKA